MSLDYCIEQARKLPKPTKKGHYRLYCVITDKKGKIIAESANSYVCTHPKQYYAAYRVGKPENIFLHAEAAAIIKSRQEGCKLFVARIGRSGEVGNAKPCKICELMIKEHGGIKEVSYTV